MFADGCCRAAQTALACLLRMHGRGRDSKTQAVHATLRLDSGNMDNHSSCALRLAGARSGDEQPSGAAQAAGEPDCRSQVQA